MSWLSDHEKWQRYSRMSKNIEDRRPSDMTRGDENSIPWIDPHGGTPGGSSPPAYGLPRWDPIDDWTWPDYFETATPKQWTAGPTPRWFGVPDNLGAYAYGLPNSLLQGLTPKINIEEATTPDSVKSHF